MECLERNRLLIGDVVLPTPLAEAEPCERQGPYGRLLGFALVTLRLVIELCPEGMPDGFRRPRHKRLAEARWTLEAPVSPRLLPTAVGDRGNTRLLLPFGSGGIACAWCATGDEKAGAEARPRAWEGWQEGEVGMALGPRRDGGVEGGEGLQGDAELGHQRMDQQGLGGDDALLGGERCGSLEGVAALGDDVLRASMVVAAAGLQGGAAAD